MVATKVSQDDIASATSEESACIQLVKSNAASMHYKPLVWILLSLVSDTIAPHAAVREKRRASNVGTLEYHQRKAPKE